MLRDLRNPERGFEAVVIGEPHRAFYGNQYGLTMPIFQHFGVPLWVPEVGGPIDPDNDAHDLIMSVFSGMSKGERNRIKVRVRTSMSAQAKVEGRYLGGRPPYGYLLADAGPHPNPAKAANGKRLHRYELDPVAAPVVARIFADYLAGRGLFSIAERLTGDDIPCPSAHDRRRDRHRSGIAWSKGAVRGILTNPKYTGYQVWNRQRKDEVLIDVDDVGLGHMSKLKWNPKDAWIWSDAPSHPPIVSREYFQTVQEVMAARGDRHTDRTVKRTRHLYQFRSLMRCALCDRRMQGEWTNDQPYYRCRFPQEYALANRVTHPRNVYLREIDIAPKLEKWLGRLFTPWNIERTVELLAQRHETPAVAGPDTAALKRQIAEVDKKLGQYRAALDAGADAVLVAGWMKEEQTRKAGLGTAAGSGVACCGAGLRPGRLHGGAAEAGDMVALLGKADPARKAKIYAELGITLTYDPSRREVVVSAERNHDSIGYRSVSEGRGEPIAHLFTVTRRLLLGFR
ncbi:recombinase family protein [Spongiactinospora sp. 9N601]|uniref:recombinase family protein n=1 Tax=Spongiactinospora sp. 9N601 TaxID=3375149 RepID=UPI0037A9E0DF